MLNLQGKCGFGSFDSPQGSEKNPDGNSNHNRLDPALRRSEEIEAERRQFILDMKRINQSFAIDGED